MGDHARCARVCWRRHKSHRFAGVIVEDLGRNLAGGQHPTHLCHHATRFLHPKAETYELFRTNFGCLEEDGGLAALRSVSRCCSKGFAVSSIRLWNRKNCSCGCHRAMDVSKKLRTEPGAKCGVGQLVISAVPAHPVQMARPGPSPITVPSFGAGRGGGTDGTRKPTTRLHVSRAIPASTCEFFTQIDFLPT